MTAYRPRGPALLTASDLRDLRDLVGDHARALIVLSLGPQALDNDAEVARLVSAGILDPSAVGALDPLQDAYLLGSLRRRLEQEGADPLLMSLTDLRGIIARDPFPLSAAEQDAIQHARTWAGQYAEGLGNRIADQVLSEVNPEDERLRDATLAAIREEVPAAMEARETAQQLASRLGHATGDWARDWGRIAATEMQGAQNEGYVEDLVREFGGPRRDAREIRVAMVPNPDACKSCRSLFLDERGRPRVYRLSELLANGTNKGRKQRDWQPTLKPVHPWCACRPVYIPDGFAFDRDWALLPESEVA